MAAAGPSRSLYEALGLEPDAADAAVRGAYKKAAVKWHPDKHVGKPSAAEAEARFREVQAAYAVLSDPAKRKKYDARGLEGLDEADLKDIVVDPASITRMEALFLSLLGQAGVAVKTEVSRQVVEAAERGEIEMRSLIMGLPRADAVAKHKAHFYALDVAAEDIAGGFCVSAFSKDSRFKLLLFKAKPALSRYELVGVEDAVREGKSFSGGMFFFDFTCYGLGASPDALQQSEEGAETLLFRRLDDLRSRKRYALAPGTYVVGVYGDNFIKQTRYNLKACRQSAAPSAVATIKETEKELLARKEALRSFELEYAAAQKVFTKAVQRFEAELKGLEELLDKRQGAYGELTASPGAAPNVWQGTAPANGGSRGAAPAGGAGGRFGGLRRFFQGAGGAS